MRFRTLVVGVASLLVAAVMPGCGDHDHDPDEGAGHRHDSVHGGVAVELGEHQFHLDVVHDSAAGTLQAWVMDAHVEDFVRVSNPAIDLQITLGDARHSLTLTAKAHPATGETVGDTSQFEGQADWLKGQTRFAAVIPALEIRGQRFTDVRFEYP